MVTRRPQGFFGVEIWGLEVVQEIESAPEREREVPPAQPLTREDLHLVCWEYVWSCVVDPVVSCFQGDRLGPRTKPSIS